jgi:hypothetical protein
MTSKERRKKTRVPFRTQIIVEYGGEKLHLGGSSVNISMGGILAETPDSIPMGKTCHVRMSLVGADPPIELTMVGTVARHDAAGFGIKFQEMDLDSYSLLREIVRHNANEPDDI